MHQPVLLREVIDLLQVKPEGTYVDGTLGRGGHALAILEKLGPNGLLVGIDRDQEALERARTRLSGRPVPCSEPPAGRPGVCRFVHGNFSDLSAIARDCGLSGIDGLLLDIGVSSEQLDQPDRGFSFMRDGPLDMRMDRTMPITAADLVNQLAEDELRSVLFRLGEERRAGRIAKAIVEQRGQAAFRTTGELAGLIERVYGKGRRRIHPATRTFQALRIKVNRELESLRDGLEAGLRLLKDGGRMAVISFHSLEDRIVKRFFKEHAGRWVSLEQGGEEWQGQTPLVSILTRKPVVAGEAEQLQNVRARSAKLRVLERMHDGPATR